MVVLGSVPYPTATISWFCCAVPQLVSVKTPELKFYGHWTRKRAFLIFYLIFYIVDCFIMIYRNIIPILLKCIGNSKSNVNYSSIIQNGHHCVNILISYNSIGISFIYFGPSSSKNGSAEEMFLIIINEVSIKKIRNYLQSSLTLPVAPLV